MEALKKNGVPIPEMLGLSENCDIIGTPFYLMDYVEGKIYKDPRLDFSINLTDSTYSDCES